jgi:signal transduction histidine kinase
MARMARAAVALVVAALGVAAGVVSIDVARDSPAYSLAGSGAPAAAALLLPALGLVGLGLLAWLRRPGSLVGPLLSIAGIAWLLPEWNNPGIGSAAGFTVGLVLWAACPPLVAHAVLAQQRGARRLDRALLAAAYGSSLVLLGVVPALLSDPRLEACVCPANLVAVAEAPGTAEDVGRVGLAAGVAWTVAVALVAAVRFARGSRAARAAARPVVLPGTAYLALTACLFAAWLAHGALANGTVERRLWLAQAASLGAVAVGLAWSRVRAARARATVAQLVVGLARSPRTSLRDSLAEIVGDPDLVVAYPAGASGRLVDVNGRSVEVPPDRVSTRLVRDGRTVAVLAHAPGLLDDEQLVSEVTGAARLALENERLQAEVRAELDELRRSRARIVESGDAERKRLERNLHDGAQQQLVALSLSLAVVRSRLDGRVGPEAVASLAAAEDELRRAVADVREVAHGLFPAVLADEGLAAAVEALAEEAAVPFEIGSLPAGRLAPPVESAAYAVVAEAARGADGRLVVDADRADGLLHLHVELGGAVPDVVALEDRVGALDGRIAVARADGRVRIDVELPCAS